MNGSIENGDGARDAPRETAPRGQAREASRHALELLEWDRVLEELAARCASAGAARAARALEPGRSADVARSLHAQTAEALALLADEAPRLGGVRDVEEAVAHARRGGVLEPDALADVARTLESFERLAAFFQPEGRRERAPRLVAIASRVAGAPALQAAIDRAIDERGGVREDATPALARLARRKVSLTAQVEEELTALRRDPDVAAALTDDYVTLRDGRHVLPVRSDRRQQVGGILHGRSGSGRSLFVEPQAVVEVNNDLRAVEIDIEEEIARILADLSGRVGEAAGEIGDALDAHREIDLAIARGRLASAWRASIPEVTVDGDLVLPGLAHPLLLALETGEQSVVRNDVDLSAEEPGLLVTGPNTGGKTVIMKAIGLACLMASAGLPTCTGEGARVPLFAAVLADVGDEQSLQRSLSSFSAHVENLLTILAAVEAATPRPSLVLLDELMSGTDPAEGAALARALMEHLASRRARAVVTTHLGDLKAFAAEHPRWRNAALEMNAATLSPTYRVRTGEPGASAALMIARRLGLPDALLDRARELVRGETLHAEALIEELEAAREEARRDRAELEHLREAASRARAEAEERLESLRARQADELDAERRRVDVELKRLRAEAASVTAELQRQPTLAAAGEAIRRLDALRDELASGSEQRGSAETESEALPDSALVVGARVRSASLRKEGEILDAPDSRGRVRVSLGGMTVQLDARDLRAPHEPAKAPRRASGGSLATALRRAALTGSAAAEESTSSGSDVPFTPRGERNSLDLRGMTVRESLDRLGRFLAEARRTDETRLLIIHGHGTGALKEAVREHLPGEPGVAGFRAGGDGEGGDGVTVVALR